MDETHQDSTFPDHHAFSLQGDFAMKENDAVLEREMEKRKIKEEIMASEMIRHQELEDEVRMELMIEKQMRGMRNSYGISDVDTSMFVNYGYFGPQLRPNYGEHLLNLGTKDVRGEMELIDHGSHVSDGLVMEEIALGKQPFDRDPSNVAAHVSEEVVAESASSADIIGMKRKAETPARACDDETTPTMSKELDQWYCSLCGVSTTSELTLNSHFQGKKHKSREVMSKAYVTSADNLTPSLQPIGTFSSEQENSLATKKLECSICQLPFSSETVLTSHLQGKKHKAKVAKLQISEITANLEQLPSEKSQEVSVPSSKATSTDTDKQWYCSLCGVSASSESNLNAHLQGKKHKSKAGLPIEEVPVVKVLRVTRLEGPNPKTEELPTKPNAEVSKDDETGVELTDITSEKLAFGLGKLKSEDDMNIDLIADNKEENISAPTQEAEGTETGGDLSMDTDGDRSMEFVKYWHCKMCNKGTHDEATMDAHRKSNEHMTLLRGLGGCLISVKTIPKEALKAEAISVAEPSA